MLVVAGDAAVVGVLCMVPVNPVLPLVCLWWWWWWWCCWVSLLTAHDMLPVSNMSLCMSRVCVRARLWVGIDPGTCTYVRSTPAFMLKLNLANAEY